MLSWIKDEYNSQASALLVVPSELRSMGYLFLSFVYLFFFVCVCVCVLYFTSLNFANEYRLAILYSQ